MGTLTLPPSGSTDTRLTTRQTDTLKAAVDRIIPADDFPSGWEAGAGDYLARLLARETQFLPAYREGLDALDGEAQTMAGRPFAGLDPRAQDALLARAEADDGAFFRLLVEQTMEGFYADPGNGGNKNGVAWDMVGFRVTA